MKITLLTLLLALSFASVKAQKNTTSKPKSEIPTVAFCDLLRNRELYAGKEVRFRALYISMFEMSALSLSSCESEEYFTWAQFDYDSIKSSSKPEILERLDHLMNRDAAEQYVVFNTELLMTAVSDKSETGHGHLGMYRFLVTVKSIEDIGETKKFESK
jgi:hypothetical protein